MRRFGLFAKKCVVNNVPGYKVIQYMNGKDIASQFVPEETYAEYCEQIGWEPVMMNEEEER